MTERTDHTRQSSMHGHFIVNERRAILTLLELYGPFTTLEGNANMTDVLLDLPSFVKRASEDSAFLKSFLRDPARFSERLAIDRKTADKLRSAQGILEVVANISPQRLALVASSLYRDSSVMSFGDFRDSPGYGDSFRDGASNGNFVDRHDNSG